MFNYTDSDGNIYFQKNLMKMTDGVLKSINLEDSLVEPI
ncbi:hypothetical protein L950_0216000 [Sphingobacterium sp. IITKGP-BTPF85]|nr:hypothetical protein L950_0216000 [Sphingobacterium sp. IITKGP-BTPF85]